MNESEGILDGGSTEAWGDLFMFCAIDVKIHVLPFVTMSIWLNSLV